MRSLSKLRKLDVQKLRNDWENYDFSSTIIQHLRLLIFNRMIKAIVSRNCNDASRKEFAAITEQPQTLQKTFIFLVVPRSLSL